MELTIFSASTDLKKSFATPPLPESVELTTFSASTDLKKSFATPPLPESVEVEQTVELRCVPPAGEPAPSVSWTKNGVIVDPKLNPNYILSSEGSLLIVAAKLSDMANYSCVAENVANRRVSRPARLTVYGMSHRFGLLFSVVNILNTNTIVLFDLCENSLAKGVVREPITHPGLASWRHQSVERAALGIELGTLRSIDKNSTYCAEQSFLLGISFVITFILVC